MMHRSARESGTNRRGNSVLKEGLCLAIPAGGVGRSGREGVFAGLGGPAEREGGPGVPRRRQHPAGHHGPHPEAMIAGQDIPRYHMPPDACRHYLWGRERHLDRKAVI
jgi:hypothetical protein